MAKFGSESFSLLHSLFFFPFCLHHTLYCIIYVYVCILYFKHFIVLYSSYVCSCKLTTVHFFKETVCWLWRAGTDWRNRLKKPIEETDWRKRFGYITIIIHDTIGGNKMKEKNKVRVDTRSLWIGGTKDRELNHKWDCDSLKHYRNNYMIINSKYSNTLQVHSTRNTLQFTLSFLSFSIFFSLSWYFPSFTIFFLSNAPLSVSGFENLTIQ